MNLCCFLVVEKWTPIVLILDHILQVPHMILTLFHLFSTVCYVRPSTVIISQRDLPYYPIKMFQDVERFLFEQTEWNRILAWIKLKFASKLLKVYQ